jgi:hypothetical protein
MNIEVIFDLPEKLAAELDVTIPREDQSNFVTEIFRDALDKKRQQK